MLRSIMVTVAASIIVGSFASGYARPVHRVTYVNGATGLASFSPVLEVVLRDASEERGKRVEVFGSFPFRFSSSTARFTIDDIALLPGETVRLSLRSGSSTLFHGCVADGKTKTIRNLPTDRDVTITIGGLAGGHTKPVLGPISTSTKGWCDAEGVAGEVIIG